MRQNTPPSVLLARSSPAFLVRSASLGSEPISQHPPASHTFHLQRLLGQHKTTNTHTNTAIRSILQVEHSRSIRDLSGTLNASTSQCTTFNLCFLTPFDCKFTSFSPPNPSSTSPNSKKYQSITSRLISRNATAEKEFNQSSTNRTKSGFIHTQNRFIFSFSFSDRNAFSNHIESRFALSTLPIATRQPDRRRSKWITQRALLTST